MRSAGAGHARRRWFVLAAAVLAVSMVIPAAHAARPADDVAPLLQPVERASDGIAAAGNHQPLIVDGTMQAVRVDLSAIDNRTVRLDLFDAVVTAEADRVERRAPGDLSWIGRPANDPDGHVVLVTKQGVLVGNVMTGGRWYAIRVLPDGTQVTMESDATIIPPGLEGDAVAAPGPPGPLPGTRTVSDGQVTIDVMIAYTPAARAANGGTAAIEALGQLAIDEINVSFANSETSPRFRLVRTAEVAYTESGSLLTELTRLIGPGDGYLDAVHAERDAAGADLVALIVSDATDYAGLAQLPNASFSVEAPFSVTLEPYVAGPYFVLAHELGHNLGGGHDPDNGNGTFSHAHGHRVEGEFRTIMSYACRRSGCPRVPHFSNPDVGYEGHATGTADSDNARTFDDTASFVAGYRSPVAEPGDGGDGVIGDWVWEDTNENGMQDIGETGVEGVTVRLWVGSVPAATAATVQDGSYRFEGLAPGTYRVEFTAPTGRSFTTQNAAPSDRDSDPAPASGLSQDVVLGAGESDLSIDAGLSPLQADAVVGDRVWEDANGNGRQDAGEPGAAGVTVRLKQGDSVVATITTAADGSYEFRGVAPGRYRIQFVAPPGRSFTVRNAGADDVDSDAAPSNGLSPALKVAAGASIPSVDAGLLPEETESGGNAAALGNRVWEDANGNGQQDPGEPGVAGVTVRLRRGPSIVASTTTAADGSYEFGGLEPGRYRVEFVAPPGRSFTRRNHLSDLSDSDASPATGRTGFVSLGAGETDLSVDAGLLP